MFLSRIALITAISLSPVALAADQPANMGGTWKLNIQKSKWGKRDKPTQAEIQIEQHDPSFKYKGSVLNADGTDARWFEFDGAIDGKSYPVSGPEGAGSITIQRVDAKHDPVALYVQGRQSHRGRDHIHLSRRQGADAPHSPQRPPRRIHMD